MKNKISRFIVNIRTVSTDPIVVRENWQSALKMLTKRGRDIFAAYRDKFQPKEKIGKKAISIDNMVITKITDKSYQAEWVENVFDIGETNARSGQSVYTGVFTVKVIPVNDEKQLIDNPLGIFIDEFHVTQKY